MGLARLVGEDLLGIRPAAVVCLDVRQPAVHQQERLHHQVLRRRHAEDRLARRERPDQLVAVTAVGPVEASAHLVAVEGRVDLSGLAVGPQVDDRNVRELATVRDLARAVGDRGGVGVDDRALRLRLVVDRQAADLLVEVGELGRCDRAPVARLSVRTARPRCPTGDWRTRDRCSSRPPSTRSTVGAPRSPPRSPGCHSGQRSGAARGRTRCRPGACSCRRWRGCRHRRTARPTSRSRWGHGDRRSPAPTAGWGCSRSSGSGGRSRTRRVRSSRCR